MTDAEPQVLARVSDGVGHLRLNRPRAINALSHGMVRLLAEALDRWAEDEAVRTVLIDGAGERGLCAGGDIRAVTDGVRADARAGAADAVGYWTDEYRLDARIARYPKPVVALMDGIVLGGGVGLSAHAAHRVVTEDSSVGMPEVAIGFVPDVGGTWLLSRAPGELGTHLALTTDRMSAADALHCGFADVFVPRARRDELLAALAAGPVDEALAAVAEPAGESPLAAQHGWIDRCYAAGSVAEVLDRLDAAPEEGARAAATAVRAMAPTALAVTLRSLRLARGETSLEQALVRELRVSAVAVGHPDFVEGVRAAVVDRDRTPSWQPLDADVDAFFASLGDRDLTFP